ncbi:TraX family protein [Variovorax paradoxus]|uniref:TraX family protein n=1 Tax=Variovorax paradoxus TaxID=34073 RepID=UPI003D6620BD
MRDGSRPTPSRSGAARADRRSPARAGSAASGAPPPAGTDGLIVADGALEALKWLAAGLMAMDHINRSLLGGAHAFLYDLGRLSMPVFGFVLMHHLARPGACAAGVHRRVMARLLGVGLLSTPVSAALAGAWPLNVLFMLLLSTAVVWLIERRRRGLAALAFVVAGTAVEFWWFGVLACLGAWHYCRRPTASRLALWALALGALWLVNRNLAALAALPLVWCAARIDLPVVRCRWLFYGFYPAHLALIWGWQRVL